MFTVFAHALGQASASPLGFVAYLFMLSAFAYLAYFKYLAKGERDIRRRGPLDPENGLTEEGFLLHQLWKYRFLAYGATLFAIVLLGAMTLDRLDREITARVHAADTGRATAEGARADAEKARDVAERQLQAFKEASAQQARDAQAARDQTERNLQNTIDYQTNEIGVTREARDIARKQQEQEKSFYDQQLAYLQSQLDLTKQQLLAQKNHDRQEADAAAAKAAAEREATRAPRWILASKEIPGCGQSGCDLNQDVCENAPSGWKVTGESRNEYDSMGGAWGNKNWGPTGRGPTQMCMGFHQHSHNQKRIVSFEFKVVPDDS